MRVRPCARVRNVRSSPGAQLVARRVAEREAAARRAEAARRSWEARWEARLRMETLDVGADADLRYDDGANEVLEDVELDDEAFADAQSMRAGAGRQAESLH